MQHCARRLGTEHVEPNLVETGVAHDGAILGCNASTGPHRFGCGTVQIAQPK